jgi:hypothetical protein
MPDVIQPKVGVICCCGEELAEGTVARLATLKLLHELRPTKTVTLCLPLFVARDEGDREFARRHPTITVDGCDLRCAARATEMYSGKIAASVVVNDVVADAGLARPEGRRALNAAGPEAVNAVAEYTARLVDDVLAGTAPATGAAPLRTVGNDPALPVACSCSSSGKPTP